MKKLPVFIAFCLFVIPSLAQIRARPCAEGCDAFTAAIRYDGACGNKNDGIFTITSHTDQTVSIKMFAEDATGKWKWLGWALKLEPGASTKFWSCNLSGRWVLYYGDTKYTNSDFPSLKNIQDQYGTSAH